MAISSASPDPARCRKAVKVLKEYERLAQKRGVRLPPRRLSQLNRLRDAGAIKSSDLPAKLRVVFPGEFEGMTLAAIEAVCSQSRG